MYIYNLNDRAKKLKIDYEGITANIKHPVLKGTSREEVLKKYLEDIIPNRYAVGTGLVVDSDENQSNQQDFFLYNSFDSPSIIRYESFQIVPIESVFCTIEIKSNLTVKELEKSVENIKSVRSLNKCPYNPNLFKFENSNNTVGFIFAYSCSMSLEKLAKKLSELNSNIISNHQISAICVLDKGLIVNVEPYELSTVLVSPSDTSIIATSKGSLEDNFYNFYLLLLTQLMTTHFYPPNMMEYATKKHTLNLKPTINIYDVPDNTFLNKENSIVAKDIKDFLNLRRELKGVKFKKLSYYEFRDLIVNKVIPYINLLQKMGIASVDGDMVIDLKTRENIDIIKRCMSDSDLLESTIKDLYNHFLDD